MFLVQPSCATRRKTCSRACSDKRRSIMFAGTDNPHYKGGAEPRACLQCKLVFQPGNYNQREHIFCSQKCHLDHQKGDGRKYFPEKCPNCKQLFTRTKKEQITCSRACMKVYLTGEKHFAWKGGDMSCICKGCNKLFTFKRGQRPNATYCSRACYSLANSQWIKCAYCGEEAKKPKSRLVYERSFCCDDHRLLWLNSPYDGSESLAERGMMGILNEMGICYTPQLPLGKYLLDFAIEDCKLDIEVDSEYHHALPGRPEADKRRDGFAKMHGWRVLRIPSMQVAKDPEGIKSAVLAAIAV